MLLAVMLALEPASITIAFWLNESALVEETVGHATVGDFGPPVPFRIAVTSVPEVRPYVALDTVVVKFPLPSVVPRDTIWAPEPASVYDRSTLTFGSP